MKVKVKVLTVSASLLVWILLVLIHLFWYMMAGLVSAFDGYDNDWRFQCLAFAVTTLPYYLLGLAVLLIIELSILAAVCRKNPWRTM